jgi:hypothetical protein
MLYSLYTFFQSVFKLFSICAGSFGSPLKQVKSSLALFRTPSGIPATAMPKTLCKENLHPEEERGSGIIPGKSHGEILTVAISTSLTV